MYHDRMVLLQIFQASPYRHSKSVSTHGTTLAEVECVVANLIYRGYVKGYISHQKAVLVVSKKDPFPTAAVMKR